MVKEWFVTFDQIKIKSVPKRSYFLRMNTVCPKQALLKTTLSIADLSKYLPLGIITENDKTEGGINSILLLHTTRKWFHKTDHQIFFYMKQEEPTSVT